MICSPRSGVWHRRSIWRREDLSTVGGHLLPGCIVNTTCELIVAPLHGWRFGTEQDAQTGYDEIVFEQTNAGEEA